MTEEAPNHDKQHPVAAALASPYQSRFPLWYSLTVFSAIALISHTTESDVDKWVEEEKWVLSVTVISLFLSCSVCLAHILMRHNFVGMPIEGLCLFTEAGLWLGGLIVMMDTENGLAVDGRGRILNANLYFFSWASFITTVALFIGYGQEASDNDLSGTHLKAGYWAGICVASLVALASSTQIFVNGVIILGQEFDCQNDSDHDTLFCERLKFSISLGTISSVLAGICSIVSSKISSTAHASASIFTLLAWVFGVAFITFGEKSPGNGVGNLFFSCWAAFIVSLFMVSISIKDYIGELEEKNATKAEQEDRPSDTDNEDAEKNGDAMPTNVDEEDNETASPSEPPCSPAPNTDDLKVTAVGSANSTPQKSNVEVSADGTPVTDAADGTPEV